MNLRASLGGTPVLEKYDLLEEIGHGGMATVYRATDKRLRREVAVKIIHKHLRENSEVATRFVAEARAAAKLRHPNIVEVYDVSADDDRYRFLVVELIRGTTLRKILQEHRDMPAEIGAAIVAEICDGLTHAHDAGIIHRDIKPENVLIELPAGCKGSLLGPADDAPAGRPSAPSAGPEATPRPGEAAEGGADASLRERRSEPERPSRRSRGPSRVVIKITDFGIAKMLDAQGVTATGQVLGSPAHMAPEQIEGGEVDPRTDVFALGVLMYEALVGHLPFEGKNPAQVLRKVLDAKYPPPEQERPSVGARWAKILTGALARELEQRTASPAVLAEQIREELAALGVADPAAELLAYFRDPAGYAAALTDRVVPALLARGEAARKRGDSPSAAADFNRALALRPTDLAILKRITSLSASRSRRAFLRRAGIIAGTSIALGVTSFGIVRYAREQPPAPVPKPSVAVAATAAPPPRATAAPDRTAKPRPTAAPDGPEVPEDPDDPEDKPRRAYTTPTVVAMTTASAQSSATASGARPTARKVRFTVIPAGGTFSLDGGERNWLNTMFELPFGAHTVRVTVPDADCCETLNGSITVTRPPPDAPDSVEHFTLRVPLRPATVRLTGAPANAQLFCAGAAVTVFAGQSVQVKLPDTPWRGTCEFRPPQADAAPRKGSVTLRAGRTNDVPWPG